MNWYMLLSAGVLWLVALAVTILFDPYERRSCVPVPQTVSAEGGPGFEFVDLGRRQVWATRDWNVEEFNDFDLPWHKPLYVKNDPRLLVADQGEITRSPGCTRDGEFNTLQAFGREFREVVRLVSSERLGQGDTELTITELEKFHVLDFHAGRAVNVLHSPEGEQFIEVARTFMRGDEGTSVPDGWEIVTYELDENLTLNLTGTVTNLRNKQQDSFQGPLDMHERF